MDLQRKGLTFLSRLPAVHWAVCGLAVVGVGLVLANWDAVLEHNVEAAAWRGRLIVVAATAWLLATAWLHWKLSRRGQPRLVLSANASRLNLLSDSLLVGVTAAIIKRGHESPLAADGVWSVCPVVLAIAVLSAVAVALSRADSAPSTTSTKRGDILIWGRVLLAAGLIVALGWLSA